MERFVLSASVSGFDASLVRVEVSSFNGLPSETIVGMADTAVKESRNRVRSAIKLGGFKFPLKAYTINLAPAQHRKEGTLLDLPIALALLMESRQVHPKPDDLFVGELSLSGRLQPVPGIVAIAQLAEARGIGRLFVPAENAALAATVVDLPIIAVSSLRDVVGKLTGKTALDAATPLRIRRRRARLDLADVNGQSVAKRVLEIAATGGHHVLFVGSPGSGKSMLLKRLTGLLPDLAPDLLRERLRVQTCTQATLDELNLDPSPPFRAPHHSISPVGLLGGGSRPRPGELSLAHRGVLFLDELAEFPRFVLDSLRQPLEDRSVQVSRARYQSQFPAHIILVAAMNPCPCGYRGDSHTPCRCLDSQVLHYWKKVSGPLLDRFDMILYIPRLSGDDLLGNSARDGRESSSDIKARVQRARSLQAVRQGEDCLNGDLASGLLEKHGALDPQGRQVLKRAVDQGLLTGRSFDRVRRVARSIADLAGREHCEVADVLEAMQYRKSPLPRLLSNTL